MIRDKVKRLAEALLRASGTAGFSVEQQKEALRYGNMLEKALARNLPDADLERVYQQTFVQVTPILDRLKSASKKASPSAGRLLRRVASLLEGKVSDKEAKEIKALFGALRGMAASDQQDQFEGIGMLVDALASGDSGRRDAALGNLKRRVYRLQQRMASLKANKISALVKKISERMEATHLNQDAMRLERELEQKAQAGDTMAKDKLARLKEAWAAYERAGQTLEGILRSASAISEEPSAPKSVPIAEGGEGHSGQTSVTEQEPQKQDMSKKVSTESEGASMVQPLRERRDYGLVSSLAKKAMSCGCGPQCDCADCKAKYGEKESAKEASLVEKLAQKYLNS